MLNKNAKKWIKALRSGKYRQGRRVLHSIDDKDVHRFCCLGVACDLYNKDKKNKPLTVTLISDAALNNKINVVAYNKNQHYLPNEVVQWLGLASPTGSYTTSNNQLGSLSNLNDGKKSFKVISDKIESKPTGLFTENV